MTTKVLLIMKKEWLDIKSMLGSIHNFHAGVWPILFISGAFAIYEPLKIGPEWLHSPIMVFSFVVLLPCAVIGFISPNTIVGERIQKTLEPLLATPISDIEILYGKISIAVIYGWGITLINMLLALIAIYIGFAERGLLLYPSNLLAPTILLSLLVSILVAIGGVYFSLYAATLLEAQNKLGAALFVPIVFAGFMVSPYIPITWKAMLAQLIPFYGAANPFLMLSMMLLLVDCLLILLVINRFRRKRLLFD